MPVLLWLMPCCFGVISGACASILDIYGNFSFDTHNYFKQLTTSGITFKHAEAHTKALTTFMSNELVRRSDLNEFKSEIRFEFSEFKAEIISEFSEFNPKLKWR